jgi:hypothetical protein
VQIDVASPFLLEPARVEVMHPARRETSNLHQRRPLRSMRTRRTTVPPMHDEMGQFVREALGDLLRMPRKQTRIELDPQRLEIGDAGPRAHARVPLGTPSAGDLGSVPERE